MSARSARRRRGLLARAFTLVEMLIAMVLTLIMVAAIAEFYARVGDSVKDGRAMIEVGSQLRNAVQRLKTDLDLLTMNVNIWNDDGQGLGYFEINEGAASDSDANGNFIPDPASLLPPIGAGQDNTDNDAAGMGGAGTPDFLEPLVTNLLGDADDWIGFTARAGDSPWVGQVVFVDQTSGSANSGTLITNPGQSNQPPPSIQNGVLPAHQQLTAPYAEIVWWTGFTDSDVDGRWDLNEPRFIVRRQLLIRPDLNVMRSDFSIPYFCRIPANSDYNLQELMQDCDVSLHVAAINSNGYDYYVANNLTDLTRRENRYMHIPFAANFPNALDLTPRIGGAPVIPPAGQTAPACSTALSGSQYRWMLNGRRRGEDVILSNVVAFDLRVHDPSANLRPDVFGAAVNLLTPGDPGYPDTLLAQIQSLPNNIAAGQGTYVDLGYGSAMQLRLQSTPYSLSAMQANQAAAYAGTYFAFQSRYNGQLGSWATYDTWSLSYERDGLNQDWGAAATYGPTYDSVANISTAPFDEGMNGLDDDGNNGVDDNGERETLPPFARPLRGIQAKLRVYEPGTRQMRQAAVAADFITE